MYPGNKFPVSVVCQVASHLYNKPFLEPGESCANSKA